MAMRTLYRTGDILRMVARSLLLYMVVRSCSQLKYNNFKAILWQCVYYIEQEISYGW